MAFTRTDTPPNTNAKITVVFSGLMLLRQAANDSCEIGIHRFDPGHTFEANLIVKKANRPPRLIRLQTGLPTSNFQMTVFPTPPPVGIRAFAATADPFDRSNQNNNVLDYRWSFNFRKLRQHDTVDFNEGAQPVATLNTGVLYTPTLSRQGLNIQQICPNPNPPPTETATPLYRVAAELAFAIDLTGNSRMVIGWNDFGKPQTQELPRAGEENEADTTYTISLLNQPPFSDPTAHDELRLYYDVLRRNGQPIPNLEQCRLEIRDAQKNDQIPCLPVLIE
jgi:hypothetical protein